MTKLTITYIKQLLKENELEWIDYEYKNNSTPILCINKDGYKVLVSLNRLKSGKIPSPFIKSNPYTLNNIKLYIKNNNLNYEVLSTKYIDSGAKLKCRCKDCDSIFYMNWDSIKQNKNCRKCSYNYRGAKQKLNLNEIKERLSLINKNIEILDSEYIDAKNPLQLKCKLDNYIWTANWNRLSQGFGCPKCSFYNMKNGNTEYANKNKDAFTNKGAMVYIIKCISEYEEFYKIGVTQRSLKRRFSKNEEMPYRYKEVLLIHTNLYNAYLLENILLEAHRDFRYMPNLLFEGYTECFDSIKLDRLQLVKKKVELEIDEIENLLK